MKLTVAIYEHRHGNDIRVFHTLDDAYAWRDEIAREWWHEVDDDDLPEPLDEAIGAAYFRLVQDEWFSTETLVIPLPPALSDFLTLIASSDGDVLMAEPLRNMAKELLE